ncbi:hypothetical protein ABIE27_004438 [Paenibacillus sp. 4624]|uniref:hypothetical protein n=1 Tax=Paenibacillus TaxID=44249 RepID=UPI003D224700
MEHGYQATGRRLKPAESISLRVASVKGPLCSIPFFRLERTETISVTLIRSVEIDGQY